MQYSLDPADRFSIVSQLIDDNVKLVQEAAPNESSLAIIDDVPGQDVTENRSGGFEISKDGYDAIQLTAAAALTRSSEGELPADLPIILLDTRTSMEGIVGYFDCLVKALAQDLGADLISVDPLDLEAFGRLLLSQDRARKSSSPNEPLGVGEAATDTKEEDSSEEEQPDQTTAHGLANFYFGGRPVDKSRTRQESALDALVSLVSIKRAKLSGNETGENRTPLLVHLKDLKVQESTGVGLRMLATFKARMKQLRSRTKECPAILGVVSEDETGSFTAHDTLWISHPPNYPHQTYTASELAYKKSRVARIRNHNVYCFRGILQAKLRSPGLGYFDDGSDEARQQWLSKVFRGTKACSEEDMTRAATQVLGKQWKTPELSFDDVASVTTRMRRDYDWDGEEEADQDGENTREDETSASESKSEPDQADVEEGDPWKDLTFEQQRDKVRPQCNAKEEELLASLVDPGGLSTTYEDVIMDEETKEQIQMLVQLSRIKPVATSQSLLKILRMSGILFYGPPGTGKTLLCKAIANQSQSRMLSLSSASLQECHVGEAEKKISAAFSLARKLVPCIIFIDEIDALFYRRSGNDKSWERSFINQFLIEMDGLTRQTDGIAPLVIVATNRPGDLDDGFLRRLPHKVLFTLPAITERKRILEGFLHKDDVGPQLNLDDLAERTRSFSGSDLRSLCEHAALAWAVEQTKTQPDQALEELRVCLDDRHFKQALTKTAPTVSPDSIKPLKLFARRFNTQSVHKLTSITRDATIESTSVPLAMSVPEHVAVIKKLPQQAVYDDLPLNRNEKEIRLLEIVSTFPQVHCRLVTASLKDDPMFCALSYVWGTTSDPQTVTVNGVPFEVTKSLADALRHVQGHWDEICRSRGEIKTPRDRTKMLIWADAICINQEDKEEKAHQVPLMGDIYSSASITFCQLDSISSNSRLPQVLDCISHLIEGLTHIHADTDLESLNEALTVLENLQLPDVGREATADPTEQEPTRVFYEPVYDLLTDFVDLKYWKRAWIFQELVLSKEVVMFYANRSLTFEKLSKLTPWIAKLSEASKSRSVTLKVDFLLRWFSSLRAIYEVDSARNLIIAGTSSGLLGEVMNEVRQLMGTSGASLQATEPKDHVYAFLGIARLDLEVSYVDTTSVKDVYIDYCTKTAELLLDTTKTPLDFMRWAGYANGCPGPHGLPTWAPNFPRCAENGTWAIPPLSTFGVGGGADWAYFPWTEYVRHSGGVTIDGEVLKTTSLVIDSVVETSGFSAIDKSEFASSIFRMLRKVFDADDPLLGLHPFLKLVSAFCQARVRWDAPEVQRVARLLQGLIINTKASYTDTEVFGVAFAKSICCDPVEIDERALGASDEKGKAMHDMFALCFEAIKLGPFEDRRSLLEAWDDSRIISSDENMQVALTASNEFALLPQQAAAGDQIVLLQGCNDLCLVRKVEDHFVFVGPVGFAHELVTLKCKTAEVTGQSWEPIKLR